jgi:hypothetical protein
MDKFGWAMLHLKLDDASLTISLSEVYDPFDDLLAWSHEVAEGQLPIEMEIDEEGRESVLAVLGVNDARRALFRVTRKYENDILLEGIVARAELGAALRGELRRFFSSEFDPDDWNGGDDSELPLRDRVLNHPWIALGR